MAFFFHSCFGGCIGLIDGSLFTERFWRNIHKQFPGFPKLSIETEEFPKERIGPYVLKELLGRGNFGEVYRSHHADEAVSKVVAVKVFDKTHIASVESMQMVYTECLALRKLSHPNVATFRGIVHAPKNIYVFMELGGFNNLLQVIRAGGGLLPVHQTEKFLKQMISGVAHCHQGGFAHRDLKADNFVVSDQGGVKLVDFGLSALLDSKRKDVVGTMPLVAPEVMRGLPENDLAAADMWSFGVLMFEMICGSGAFRQALQWPSCVGPTEERAEQLENCFGNSTVSREYLKEASATGTPTYLVDLASSLLQVEPGMRYDALKARRVLYNGVMITSQAPDGTRE